MSKVGKKQKPSHKEFFVNKLRLIRLALLVNLIIEQGKPQHTPKERGRLGFAKCK